MKKGTDFYHKFLVKQETYKRYDNLNTMFIQTCLINLKSIYEEARHLENTINVSKDCFYTDQTFSIENQFYEQLKEKSILKSDFSIKSLDFRFEETYSLSNMIGLEL